MFFFLRKKRANRDAQIKAIKKDILKKQDKVNERLDATLLIFYATNGERGQKHG